MKRKLLLLFVLLMTAATGAWADDVKYLYLDISGTSATLMYGTPDDNPYYTGSGWDGKGASTAQSNVTTITVAGSCGGFTGTSLFNLFRDFTVLTTINDIGNLNTSGVENMDNVFYECAALTTLDLRKWNTAKVSSMNTMFAFCVKLTSLDISGWNTASVTNMSGMFNNCTSLTTLDLTSLNTTNVTNMSSMFFRCLNLTAIYVGNYWNTDKITEDKDSNSKDMFYACSNLPNWDEEKIDKTRANTGADGYLNKVKVTANLANGAYWGTFYSNVGNHLAPEGTQVFAVNLNTSTAEITMTEIEDRIVKSNQGVVLKKTGSGDATTTIIMTLTGTEPTGNFITNSLQGTMTSITNPGNAYVLSYKEGTGVGFYKLKDTGTIGANKAYLTYSGSLARGFFGLDDNNGTTGIEMPVVEGNDNADTVIYDLQGRRVLNPTKGLYIVNGKKVVIK